MGGSGLSLVTLAGRRVAIASPCGLRTLAGRPCRCRIALAGCAPLRVVVSLSHSPYGLRPLEVAEYSQGHLYKQFSENRSYEGHHELLNRMLNRWVFCLTSTSSEPSALRFRHYASCGGMKAEKTIEACAHE